MASGGARGPAGLLTPTVGVCVRVWAEVRLDGAFFSLFSFLGFGWGVQEIHPETSSGALLFGDASNKCF